MRKFFDSIPPDEVDYNFKTAPYIKPRKSGTVCLLIGAVLMAVASCADETVPILTIAIYAALAAIFVFVGVMLREP